MVWERESETATENVCDHSVIVPIKVNSDDAFDCKYWIKFHSKLITSNWVWRCVKREWVNEWMSERDKVTQSHYRGRDYVYLLGICVHTVHMCRAPCRRTFIQPEWLLSSIKQTAHGLIAKRVHWHIIFNQLWKLVPHVELIEMTVKNEMCSLSFYWSPTLQHSSVCV